MTRLLSSRTLWAQLLTLLIALGIAWGTLSPSAGGPSPLPLTDKQIHALAFACLIFPLALVSLRRALWIAPLCILFGAVIELVQPTVGRSAEWADLAADTLGVLLGLALAFMFRGRRLRA